MKAEDLINKHLTLEGGSDLAITDGRIYNAFLNALNEAINYTRCCTQLLCIDRWCYNDLTKGNKYKLITEDDEYYTIVNDWGEICQKDKDLFELIKQ